MNRFDWLPAFMRRLREARVPVRQTQDDRLPPAKVLDIDPEDWGRAGRQAANFGFRWAAVWADHLDETLAVFSLFEHAGDYLALRTQVDVATPLLPSHTPYFPAADRPERHVQDMFGIAFSDHPDARRWIRHQAWEEDEYPLRRDFLVAGRAGAQSTPPDDHYPFLRAQGAGVYEIPVGPVHAGIIEPGHFRFQAVGETILNLEERLGYVHKGIEKIAVGRGPDALARLAGRVSGDSTVAHTWAACQAMERALNCEVPPRAQVLRALFSERERIANHLGNIGAICNDVGFAFAIYQFSRLREDWQRRNQELFGHRFLMDRIVPGGVAVDLAPEGSALLRADQRRLAGELDMLFDILEDHPSLEDRLLTTGRLLPETARRLGCLGYVGKASGQDFDVRRDHPYPPYDQLTVPVAVFEEGDVAARMRVRMQEIRDSLVLIDHLLDMLPEGETQRPLPTAQADREGLGIVEGWRGEIVCYVRFGEDGSVARYHPRDPSWLNWPALERIVLENIVPDFPVCNKSVNGSYSGQDL